MVQDFVIYSNDLTAKIFFFLVLLGYAIYMYWKIDKLDMDRVSSKVTAIFYFIYSRVVIFFFPLIVVVLLHINVTLEELIIVTSGFYGIVFVMALGFLFLFGFEKVIELLGLSDGRVFKK